MRDRSSDPDTDSPGIVPWDQRALFGSSRGIPWWGAVLAALLPSAVGAAVDMVRQDSVGIAFQVGYVSGCLAAVALVRRRGLFGPMVQPPLVFVVVFVAAYLIAVPSPASGFGLKEFLFSVGLPLASNFPTMAVGAAAALAVGIYRFLRQRNPDQATRKIDVPDRRGPREPRPSSAERPTRRPRAESRDENAGARERRGGRERRPESSGRSSDRGKLGRGSGSGSSRDQGHRGSVREGRGSRDPAARRRPRRDDDYRR